MEETFIEVSHFVKRCIDSLALTLLAAGTVQAFIGAMKAMLIPSVTAEEARQIWMRYSRLLVAALTFQLAADILESAIAPTWSDIGKLAAIAAIRTFLNFFLDRDMETVRKRSLEDTEQRERVLTAQGNGAVERS